ncbi:MAG: site-specific DNA-methyltransferase [Halomonas subglaciescola]|nr:site-specific DNA-methyltransferase [Halomonas subglaciescola]
MPPPHDLQGLTPEALAAFRSVANTHACPEVMRYLEQMEQRHSTIEATLTEARHAPLYSVQRTTHGTLYEGNALTYMQQQTAGSLDLIMTSPPFGLVRKKAYGNAAAEEYCDWFRPFAMEMYRLLSDTGSLVIDIGGSWEKGQPTRSLYHYDLLVMLVREFGFYLCLEHYWFSPSKLPSPAEWVTIRRIRPKDAVNCVWWLSKTPFPKASNKRVLSPYSDSMENLLRKGYEGRKRPSGHDISERFSERQQGAIPSNLLAIANTESSSHYSAYCREHGYPIHPARFPAKLPEYFIRMLTDPGDQVFDPFAGSFLTGRVCEELGRKWAGTEVQRDYIQGALSRFAPDAPNVLRYDKTTYALPGPCAFGNTDDVPLVPDGGRHRANKRPASVDAADEDAEDETGQKESRHEL